MYFQLLMNLFKEVLEERDPVLLPISETLFPKLKYYEQLVCTDVADVARILDPRFPNDVIRDN